MKKVRFFMDTPTSEFSEIVELAAGEDEDDIDERLEAWKEEHLSVYWDVFEE